MFDSVPFHDLIEVIIKILDTRDPYTFEHSWRVAAMSEQIAKLMKLDADYIKIIHTTAHLHDLGKIGVPDAVLNKATRLTDREFELMKDHSRMGFEIVNKTDIFADVGSYILYHHERWDGGGYPEGLAGRAIPLGSRIIAVADSFDAITSSRPYRSSRSYEEGFTEIRRGRGSQFCPDTASIFLEHRMVIIASIDEANQEIERYYGKPLMVRSEKG